MVAYVTDTGISISSKDFEKMIGQGTNACVYGYGDYAVKVFRGNDYSHYLSKEMYETMKSLELAHILKAIALHYRGIIKDQHSGYIMLRKENNKKKCMIDTSLQEIFTNMDGLQKEADLLAENHILINNVNYKNAFFSDLLCICGIDTYYCAKNFSIDKIRHNNRESILYLLLDFLKRDIDNLVRLGKIEVNHGNSFKTKMELLIETIKPEYDIVSELRKTLGTYETPKQFILK